MAEIGIWTVSFAASISVVDDDGLYFGGEKAMYTTIFNQHHLLSGTYRNLLIKLVYPVARQIRKNALLPKADGQTTNAAMQQTRPNGPLPNLT